MSDTQSLKSEDSTVTTNGGASIFVEIESVGKLSLADSSAARVSTASQPYPGGPDQKKFAIQDGLIAVLNEDGAIVFGDIRPDRGSSDTWILQGRTSTILPLATPQTGGRYLDLALIQTSDKSCVCILVLLGERKNKERFLAAHQVRYSGRNYEIGDEKSVFDKSNILGKGISNITSDQESVFTVSNLVRKIKFESGSVLRPTPARAQVPNDCLDGTLSVCALSNVSKKSSSKTNFIVLSSKTKSAGKNKFAIEWYTCNKKDELSLIKGSSMRLHEDSEPCSLLRDPKDGRSVFVIYNNRSRGTSSLVKLTKSAASGAIVNWDFLVSAASMGWINDNLTIALMTETSAIIQLYTIHKTDGHRSKQPGCAECEGLQSIQSIAHLTSMATTNWRLSDQAVDENMGYANKSSTSIALASLCNEDNLAAEPESGHPYRVRVVGCPIRGLTPVAIVLEDLDRCFDGDFTALSNYVLKICLSMKPCIGCVSLLSSWVKSEKLAAVDVYYARSGSDLDDMDQESFPESRNPRLSIKSISREKFRSLITDTDWTTLIQQHRPTTALTESICDGGTFTLEPETGNGNNVNGPNGNGATMVDSSKIGMMPQRPMSASVCSNRSSSGSFGMSFNSRIPMPKSSTVMNSSLASSTGTGNSHNEEVEELFEANQRLRSLVQRLAATLTTILDVDVALRNNLMNMHEIVQEVQEEVSLR